MPSRNEHPSHDLRALLEEIQMSLQPIDPVEAVERYLKRRKPEIGSNTVDEYQRKLDHFIEFCSRREIENLNELDGRTIDDYRVWRREESTEKVDSLGSKTMRDEMYLFRAFLSYLESIEGVYSGLSDKVTIPELSDREGVRDVELPPERVQQILDYLETYKYGHREHVVWLLHCRTGRRPGDIHSLDVDDFNDDGEKPYLTLRHRPDQATQLKNDGKSEGEIPLSEQEGAVIRDYIENRRRKQTDEFGRRPLFTSSYGRLSTSTMRKYFYKWSRPCKITGDCPHDREIEECVAMESNDQASKCPSSEAPYSTRHGYITDLRRAGVPKSVVSERCDVSEAVLDKHYDERTDGDRRKLQREILEKIREQATESQGGYMA